MSVPVGKMEHEKGGSKKKNKKPQKKQKPQKPTGGGFWVPDYGRKRSKKEV